MSKAGSVGSCVVGSVGCGCSDGLDASVAGSADGSVSGGAVGAVVSCWRSGESGVLDGSLGCVCGVVSLSQPAGTVSVCVFRSDSLAVASAVGSASFCAVPWGFSTSVFCSVCAVFAWSEVSLLPEEETGAGSLVIGEVLLHPVVRHKRPTRNKAAILAFIRFTPFDHILPDATASDKGAFQSATFYHSAESQISELCEPRPTLR